MTAPQINALPVAPDRNNPAQFANRADALVASLGGLVTQTNAVATFVNDKSIIVQDSSVAAVSASEAAVGAANFKGAWSTLTGSLSIPASVSNSGAVWVLNVNIPDVTASEPNTTNTDWVEVKVNLQKQVVTGSSQAIDFSKDKIAVSTAGTPSVAYSFINPSPVVKIDLIVEGAPIEPYALLSGRYEGKAANIQGQDTAARGIAFSNDGLKFFMVGSTGRLVYQYTVAVAFQINTISFDSITYDISNDELLASDLLFNADGTKMYITGRISDEVNVFNLSTAFDISTTTDPNISFSFAAQEANASGMSFNNDFTKLYVVGSDNDTVFQYNLSTADDITTAVYSNKSFSGGVADPVAIKFNPAGTKMFLMSKSLSVVQAYVLSTADDVSTATIENGINLSGNSSQVFLSVGGQETSAEAMCFTPDGNRLYVIGLVSGTVFQYTTTSYSVLIFPSNLQAPNVSLLPFQKTALTIITTDSGATYQVISAQGGID
jgi:hypothetical protein